MGAMARYGANLLCTELLGKGFPWGTLVVNVLGCFALGWLVHVAKYTDTISPSVMLSLGTGFLGSFTTYSTFGVETIQAWYSRPTPFIAVFNVAGHVVLGLLAVLLGIYLATYVHGLRDA